MVEIPPDPFCFHTTRFMEPPTLSSPVSEPPARFSPLHRAYLELFQHLFPEVGSVAQRVMSRLEAIAHIRAELTKVIRTPSPLTMAFSPWKPEDIAEGQVVEMGQGRKRRYADLVCYGEGRKPLMVVEYVEGGSSEGARSAWDNLRYSGLQCLVLVDRKEGGQVSTTVYTEHPKEHFLRPTERWNLPRPRDSKSCAMWVTCLSSRCWTQSRGVIQNTSSSSCIIGNVRSLSHRMVAGRGFQRLRRRILDGLAATDDERVGVRALLHAAPDPHYREHQGMGGTEAEIERWTEQELLAPLFWRLPVEAAFSYQREHQMQLPSVAGHKLLAEEVMGLHYDVYRTFRRETDALARRVERDGLRQLTENYTIHDLYHLWRREELKYLPSDTPPAALVRDGLTAIASRSENGVEDGQANEWANEVLRDKERPWIVAGKLPLPSGFGNKRSLGVLRSVIRDPLPSYGGPQPPIAPMLWGQASTTQERRLHPSFGSRLRAYQARDLDGLPGYGFAAGPSKSPFHRENPVHAVITKCFAYKLIELLQDSNLKTAFDKLSDHQPEHYCRWRVMCRDPLERMRIVLSASPTGGHVGRLAGTASNGTLTRRAGPRSVEKARSRSLTPMACSLTFRRHE